MSDIAHLLIRIKNELRSFDDRSEILEITINRAANEALLRSIDSYYLYSVNGYKDKNHREIVGIPLKVDNYSRLITKWDK